MDSHILFRVIWFKPNFLVVYSIINDSFHLHSHLFSVLSSKLLLGINVLINTDVYFLYIRTKKFWCRSKLVILHCERAENTLKVLPRSWIASTKQKEIRTFQKGMIMPWGSGVCKVTGHQIWRSKENCSSKCTHLEAVSKHLEFQVTSLKSSDICLFGA